jgi:hypothetical protein
MSPAPLPAEAEGRKVVTTRFRELTARWLQLEIELSRLSCEEGRRRKG